MEYVYAALVLHSLGKKVDEKSVTDVIAAAGGSPDASKVKALIASLDGVDIAVAIKNAAMPVAAAPVAAAAPAAAKEEKKDEKKTEEEAAAGLASLFG